MNTMTSIATQGMFSDWMIFIATEVFPDPEQPAIPMMLVLAHGGE